MSACLVIWEGAGLAVFGLSLGLPASIAASGLLRGLLYGVSAQDSFTLGTVAVVLAIATLLATLLPSWRAARVDPNIVLREVLACGLPAPLYRGVLAAHWADQIFWF